MPVRWAAFPRIFRFRKIRFSLYCGHVTNFRHLSLDRDIARVILFRAFFWHGQSKKRTYRECHMIGWGHSGNGSSSRREYLVGFWSQKNTRSYRARWRVLQKRRCRIYESRKATSDTAGQGILCRVDGHNSVRTGSWCSENHRGKVRRVVFYGRSLQEFCEDTVALLWVKRFYRDRNLFYFSSLLEISKNRSKKFMSFSSTFSRFCERSPFGENRETGGNIFAIPVPWVATEPSRNAFCMNA